MLSKKLSKKTGSSIIPIILLFAAALFVIVLGPGVMGLYTSRAADEDEHVDLRMRGSKVCSKTAQAALLACNNEIKDDFWITVGKCNNLSDAGERASCFDLSKEELVDSKALCKDQLEARLELCEQLGEAPYDPKINPTDFVDFKAVVDGEDFTPNPYFPLVPGSTRIYIVKDAEGNKIERLKVEVLKETKEILGVNCIVIRDRVWEFDEEGEQTLIEDTDDWYGQDSQGNVWYFGEIAQNFEDGELIDVEGSWKAGRDRDTPGFIMLADPVAGDLYRQEFSLGNAEDVAEVVKFVDTLTVRGTTYEKVLMTRDFTPIEPGPFEFKYYAPGIGLVLEENPANGERLELKRIITP